MSTVINVVLFSLHVLFSLVMVMFILMHRGTGGGLSDMFGGGASSLQGSAVVERNLDRFTIVSAIGFVFTTVLLELRLS